MANNRPVPKALKATGWLRAMEPGKEGGGSEPHQFATDDGSYMVKAPNNPQSRGGARILANELVGGLCLDWLGVAHPEPAVVDVPAEVIEDSPKAKFNDGTTRFGSGKAFGSRYCQSDPAGAVGVDQLANKPDIAGTAAFDTWVRPGDARQYRVRKSSEHQGKYDFIPVDQGHSFGPNWTAAGLNADRGVTVAAPVAPLKPADMEPFIKRLREFKEEDAAHIVAQVPEGWLGEAERKALKDYLVARATAAADALAEQYRAGGEKA